MTEPLDAAAAVRPELIRRDCGGWLAIAPHGACFSMGVTAGTEEEARDKFRYVFARWLEIVNDTKYAVT